MPVTSFDTPDSVNFQSIFTEAALYSTIEHEGPPEELLLKLYSYQGHVDCYCLSCNDQSVFRVLSGEKQLELGKLPATLSTRQVVDTLKLWGKQFSIEFYCSRGFNHRLHFVFLDIGSGIQKIGQFPSIADLANPDLKKYKGTSKNTQFTNGMIFSGRIAG